MKKKIACCTGLNPQIVWSGSQYACGTIRPSQCRSCLTRFKVNSGVNEEGVGSHLIWLGKVPLWNLHFPVNINNCDAISY